MSRFSLSAATLAAFCTVVPLAHAALITDPVGDFLATYTGPKNGDMDVISAQVFYDGTNFTFFNSQNGAVGTTPGGVYVWGVNRGTNLAPFGAFAPGVLFDAVVVLESNGTGLVIDITGAVPTVALPAANVIINGNTIEGIVSASLLKSLGFSPENFGVNVWSRDGLASGAAGLAQIADFAPNNSDAAVTTPEPATGLLLGSVMGLAAFLRRLQKRAA